MKLREILAATLLFVAEPTFGSDIKPAILYDLGGKFDKGFNESFFVGVEKFKEETGSSFLEFEPSNDAQREQALQTFARQGADPIAMIGFGWGQALERVAPKFPATRFILVASKVDLPNVHSIEFAHEEAAFMVGALAGLKTTTNTIGFVGGMDIPLIREYLCAYQQGAELTQDSIRVVANMVGATPAAWSDPIRGRELALGQFAQGADIVFAAAGGTGVGVLQAAADTGKLAIGADSNQNGIQPGYVLTSATLGIDVAIFNALMEAADGEWSADAKRIGLKDHGVGWSLDENNRPMLDAADLSRMEEIKEEVVDGKIKVKRTSDGNCS